MTALILVITAVLCLGFGAIIGKYCERASLGLFLCVIISLFISNIVIVILG